MESDRQLHDDLHCLDEIIRHIQTVQENCIVLGKRLIENGEEFLGRTLIHNGFQHDASKFIGSEWDYMRLPYKKKLTAKEKQGLEISVSDHNRSNLHHPEYWNGIQNMPDVYIAEMVCDWKARSSEFGTSLLDWITDQAAERFNFSMRDEVGLKIIKFVEMLTNKPFEKIDTHE
jgi:hypothetical protein